MRSRALILGVSLALALVLATALVIVRGRGSTIRPGRTNVVLVIIDTLRADHVGCYGYDRPTSVNIDAFAQRGVVFDQAVVNCSWTRPSMASILTGIHPRQTGIYKEEFDSLPPDMVTLAEMFRARDYATYGITANPNINAAFGFDQGFDEYGDCGVLWGWMKGKMFEGTAGPGQRKRVMENADSVTDRSLALLERHRSGPFYLQVLYIDPHSPYEAPGHFDHQLNQDPTDAIDRYDAEVAFADAEMGRLLAWVLERYPDTLIIITSDHGEGLRDHPGVPFANLHGFTLYDSNLVVPLIYHHAALASGTRFGAQVQLLDLVPTVADLFDLPLDGQVEGTSLASVLYGRHPPPLPTQAFSETEFNHVEKISVREPGLKLVVNRDHTALIEGRRPDLDDPEQEPERRAVERCGPIELYRVPGNEDPTRKGVNLASRDRAAVGRLEVAIADFEDRVRPRPPINRNHNREVDSTIIEQLRALGYLRDHNKVPEKR
jgi:arylsulfatase A-like enzyme